MPPLRPSTMWRLSSCGVDGMAGNVAVRSCTPASAAVALLELDSAAARAWIVAARLRLDATRRWLGRMVHPVQTQRLRCEARGVDLRVTLGRVMRRAARLL